MKKLKYLLTSTNEDSSNYAFHFSFFFLYSNSKRRRKRYCRQKSSVECSSMIEIAYDPSLVLVDLDDFGKDFEEFEDSEDYEEYSH